jgi:hypothetical protein
MAADQERADRIRALKQDRPDLTWRRIADHVGVTERSATDWQSKGGISYENAGKLAALFEVDVDYIWRGPSQADRAPSPFAAQDMQGDLAGILERIEAQLDEQNEVLDRIEKAVESERQARAESDAARRDLLDLLAAVDAATRANLDAAQRAEEARGKSAT